MPRHCIKHQFKIVNCIDPLLMGKWNEHRVVLQRQQGTTLFAVVVSWEKHVFLNNKIHRETAVTGAWVRISDAAATIKPTISSGIQLSNTGFKTAKYSLQFKCQNYANLRSVIWYQTRKGGFMRWVRPGKEGKTQLIALPLVNLISIWLSKHMICTINWIIHSLYLYSAVYCSAHTDRMWIHHCHKPTMFIDCRLMAELVSWCFMALSA